MKKKTITFMPQFRRGIRLAIFAIVLLMFTNGWAQSATITVDATKNKRLISPNIYGKNDFFDRTDQFYKDAGLKFARLNGGNNASSYNWQAKLTVHPDWYNNVYATDWNVAAQKINTSFPGMQGMFAFQLLGRVASNTNNNFDDWAFNQAKQWSGTKQDLAGGGVVNTAGGHNALVDGNPELFSKPWTADSSVGILKDWFGAGGKGFNKDQFVYWNMDNEVDIWHSTHKWAMPKPLSAAAFMDRYIELAKKAKAIYPGIKLCGPVNTSEWYWYNWPEENIRINGRSYTWMEYFIKRLGDEYKATGMKLVDVVDIHNYPEYKTNNADADALQGHRIYYDENYDYPSSNGISTINGGWDTSIKKQYIFKRIDGWLNEHFGANHGITTGISEWGTGSSSNPSLESVIYASHLGTFANNGVELFSPWNWSVGMWETLHLFSKNAKKYSVSSVSTAENTVSAYSSISDAADQMTVIIVNKDMNSAQNVTVNLNGFQVANGNYKTLQLSSLPANETFVSETQNALKTSQVGVNSNSLTISVPKLSTTAILLTKTTTPSVTYVTLANRGTGLLMDGMYRSDNGSNAGQYANSGATAQQWSIETVGNYVMLKNRATNLYLDGMYRSSNGSVTGQYSYSGSDAQYWTRETAGSYVKFKNKATGLYIDGIGNKTNGADLAQWSSSSHFNQQWSINTVSSAKMSSISEQNSTEESSLPIVLYPNPFSSAITLKVDEPNKINDISIFDMTGKLVESIPHSEITSSMSIGSSLTPNIYIVKVSAADGVKTFKIVKK
ncbi:glycoside hydrolase family 44 protein [Flavobacterium piscis]|uniref:Por secretion system C-terminal sorting domain-containing protein n=1 Tax=Flavobacterium piscis TaxID=1114874 RepID=A0ABU1YAL2_9FLAO|nr:glycoside hydrolase family 44 protein [Flavobacterium piscis]MDR7210685.1 hypothetical protein [Flavobacterium piscis]